MFWGMLVLVASVTSERPIRPLDPCTDAARFLIRRQLWAETASIRSEPDTAADPSLTDPGIWFKIITSDIEGVRVVRGLTQVSHWHSYVVACHEDKVYRMAGFGDSDVHDLSTALSRRINSESDAVRFAAFIAAASDPQPTKSLIVTPFRQADTADSSMIATWAQMRPATWPREHAAQFSDGSIGVTLTRISHDSTGIRTATSCSYLIHSGGQILASSCNSLDFTP